MPRGQRAAPLRRPVPPPPVLPSELARALTAAVTGYLEDLDGHPGSGLYDLVLREIEIPLLRLVLEYTGGNLSQAARLLGLSRATLRKKLTAHGLL